MKAVRLGAQGVGFAAIAFGVLADVLGPGSSPGMGLKQWAIVLAGAALVTAARIDRGSAARAVSRVRAWAGDHADAMSFRPIALFAVTVGLATGLVETLVLAIDRFVVNGFVRVGPNILWMAPLGDAAILLTLGALLWLGARLWPKLATPSVVGFVFFLLAADAVLHRVRVHGWISIESKVILLLAVALTVGRLAGKRWDAGGTRNARIAAAAAVLIALLGGAAALHPWWKERGALAALPDARPGGVNVVFIILDTVRAASLSLYGYERPTSPELERFAQAGVVFENAISPSSWTLPSHGTMFTGRHPDELGVDWLTPFGRPFPMLAEVFAEAGYATAGFSANTGYVSVESGLARGFARFEDFVPTPGELVRTWVMLERVLTPFGLKEVVKDDDRGRRSAEDISGSFLAWLDRRPEDRPFFAFLNFFDLHSPYYAPSPFDTLFGGTRKLRPWGPNLNEQDVQDWRDAYDRSLVYLDAQLGILFAELERRGVMDNTVVVVSSDHGEHMGEHSFMGHATTLYRPVLEIPLVFRGPGVPPGTRVAARVSMRDLAASLLDLAGVDAQGRIPGRSLAAAWQAVPVDEPVYSALGMGKRMPLRYPNAEHDLWSIYEGDFHYIASSSGAEELYRLSADPGEEDNLVASGQVPAAAASLRARLRTHFEATGRLQAWLTAGEPRQ